MPNKLLMKDFVVDLLQDNIPLCYYYHNYEHTLYVQEKVMEIGRHEHCTEKEIELFSAAALWHDTGYINSYKNHEEESCSLAKKYLPQYGFTNNEITLICGMIMATKVPQMPHTHLQKIICDADLDYLGRNDFFETGNKLRLELIEYKFISGNNDWEDRQLVFLQAHHYFTKSSQEKRGPVKMKFIQELLKHKNTEPR